MKLYRNILFVKNLEHTVSFQRKHFDLAVQQQKHLAYVNGHG